jgi:hypothetical protein
MKNVLRILAAVALCANTAAPVLAADNTDTDDVVTAVSLFPARVLGVAAGAAIGIPVATVRATAERTLDMHKQIAQALPDEGSPANIVYSYVAAAPAGLLSGVIEGPYYALRNAGRGFEHPFSAESLSLQSDDLTRRQTEASPEE